MKKMKFVCYFWFVGWDCISLGFHICSRNIEIHLPFGFIRIGFEKIHPKTVNYDAVAWRAFGIGY